MRSLLLLCIGLYTITSCAMEVEERPLKKVRFEMEAEVYGIPERKKKYSADEYLILKPCIGHHIAAPRHYLQHSTVLGPLKGYMYIPYTHDQLKPILSALRTCDHHETANECRLEMSKKFEKESLTTMFTIADFLGCEKIMDTIATIFVYKINQEIDEAFKNFRAENFEKILHLDISRGSVKQKLLETIKLASFVLFKTDLTSITALKNIPLKKLSIDDLLRFRSLRPQVHTLSFIGYNIQSLAGIEKILSLETVHMLKLSHNWLNLLDVDLLASLLPNLKYFYADNCHINIIKGTFAQLPNLSVLDLRHNNILKIAKRVKDTNIQQLYLASNASLTLEEKQTLRHYLPAATITYEKD